MPQNQETIAIQRAGALSGFRWFKHGARQALSNRWKTFILFCSWIILMYPVAGLFAKAGGGWREIGLAAYFSLWPLWAVSGAHAYEAARVGRWTKWRDFFWGFTPAGGVLGNWGLGVLSLLIAIALQIPAVALLTVYQGMALQSRPGETMGQFQQEHLGVLLGIVGLVVLGVIFTWMLLWMAPALRAQKMSAWSSVKLSAKAGLINALPSLALGLSIVIALAILFGAMGGVVSFSLYLVERMRVEGPTWQISLGAVFALFVQLALFVCCVQMIGLLCSAAVKARREAFTGFLADEAAERAADVAFETPARVGVPTPASGGERMSRGERRRAERQGRKEVAQAKAEEAALAARQAAEMDAMLADEPNPTVSQDELDRAEAQAAAKRN